MNEEEFNKFKDQVLKNLELHQQLLNKYKLLQVILMIFIIK
jgi:hypothetical protein